jgi:two-component system, chemotaxis family, chemotaxis protein CheY
LADDARFMRQAIRAILEAEGFDVVGEAADGRAVVAEYARLRPDVVTVDVRMPEHSGVAAAPEILTLDPGKRCAD